MSSLHEEGLMALCMPECLDAAWVHGSICESPPAASLSASSLLSTGSLKKSLPENLPTLSLTPLNCRTGSLI